MRNVAICAVTMVVGVLAGCYNVVDEPLGYRASARAQNSDGGASSCPDVPTTIFATQCASCHNASLANGGLDLASAGVAQRVLGKPALTGGVLADPAHPQESVLYQRLLGKKGPRMPAGAAPLDANETGCVLSWIQTLATAPVSTGSETGRPPIVDGPSASPSPGPNQPPTNPQARPSIRVAAGSPSDYTDQAGNTWQADTGFSAGQVAINAPPVAVANTTEDALYNHERWGGDGAGNFVDFAYTFALPDGAYTVTLKFAETYSEAMGVGKRRFDVSAAGTKVLSDFDIFAAAGANAAIDKTFDVTVTGGSLTIAFVRGAALTPKIDGIQVIPR